MGGVCTGRMEESCSCSLWAFGLGQRLRRPVVSFGARQEPADIPSPQTAPGEAIFDLVLTSPNMISTVAQR